MSPPAASQAELLDAAVDAVRTAGRLVREAFGTRRVETAKGSVLNLVTDVDRAAEDLIVSRLRRRFPGHSVVAEEGGRHRGAEITWWVDPLDGTNNFAHGYPMVAVTVAAAAGDEVLCGATYDPLRDELFTATAGDRPALNGAPLAVSRRAHLNESLVATGFPYDKASNPDNNLAQFVAVTPLVRGIRRSGSAALDLAYVAAGRLEAYWEHGTRPWDVAAGVLLVTGAGGSVTDPAGGPAKLDGGRFVASNGLVHAELLAALAAATPLP